MMHILNPIGFFRTSLQSLYDLPRQPNLMPENEGIIELLPHCQFEQGLEGLDGFDLIWVIFHFHKAASWKPKVLPPRGGNKQGVFATRSPHRPNHLGLSCVKLVKIQGLKLFVQGHDLTDGTPIIDIKPYINYADSVHSARQGWLDNIPEKQEVHFAWSDLARDQLDYLLNNWGLDFQSKVEHRLGISPIPYPNHRVKQIGDARYQLAYRTWRFEYTFNESSVLIQTIRSGYDDDTLAGMKEAGWDDLPIHQAYILEYP